MMYGKLAAVSILTAGGSSGKGFLMKCMFNAVTLSFYGI